MFFYPATVHFQSCTVNVNKINVVLCFRKLICAFSLTCFKVRMCKISDKSDTFSLNYSNLFRGPLFSGHSVHGGRFQFNNQLFALNRIIEATLICVWAFRTSERPSTFSI